MLLPYLGQDKLARQYDLAHDWWEADTSANRTAAQCRVAAFVCPSAPHPERWVLTADPGNTGTPFKAAPTDYVGVAGAYLRQNGPANLHAGAMANGLTLRTTEIADGTSTTLLVVEMADKPNVWRTGALARDNATAPQMTTFGGGQWAAPNWNHLRSYSRDGRTPFGPCAVNCSNAASVYGFHTGGANVLFVDGSTRFLRAGLAEEVLVALVSYNGGEVLASDDY